MTRPPRSPVHDPDPDPRPDRHPGPPLEGGVRIRIALFTAILIIGALLVLDVVTLFVLPVPPEVSANTRKDLLLFGPVALLVAFTVTFVELRSVSRALGTLRLRLRLTDTERRRALRAALGFPVILPLFVLGVGTLGNVVTFMLDLFGRSPGLWYGVHITVVTQCIMICVCFPMFVFARFTLRPFIRAMAREGEPLGRSVGLRGRIGLLVSTLVALVALPTASLLSLQLDAEDARRRAAAERAHVAMLGHELQEMGLHSFAHYVRALQRKSDPSSTVFVMDARGQVTPQSVSRDAHRAGLGQIGRAHV